MGEEYELVYNPECPVSTVTFHYHMWGAEMGTLRVAKDSSLRTTHHHGCGAGGCGQCEGDCDNDNQCAPGLVCFERDGATPVPGCTGTGTSSWDYCVLADTVAAPVWTKSGDQGNVWHTATATVDAPSFSFKYTRGDGWKGDAAVGDVTVRCAGGAADRVVSDTPETSATCGGLNWGALLPGRLVTDVSDLIDISFGQHTSCTADNSGSTISGSTPISIGAFTATLGYQMTTYPAGSQ